MTLPTSPTGLRWNWPHLLLLVSLPVLAWLADQADLAPGTLLTVGTVLALAWLMVAERRWPARPAWTAGAAELQRDTVFLGLGAVADAAGAVLVSWLALLVVAAAPGPAAGWSPWLALPLAIALGELGPYALHRWAHRGGWAWRVHRVHHAPVQVNASNNLCAHPINVLWNQLARALPWLVLGFDAQVVVWAALFIQVQSFAVHANIGGSIGPLNKWIGSAELHRWHHSLQPAEAQNFGTALPLWDQVFGTAKSPSVAGPLGVGVQGVLSQPGWRGWRGLLLAPICQRCAG